MNKHLAWLIILTVALGGCAGGGHKADNKAARATPSQLENLNNRLREARAGDFGEFMTQLHYARQQLDRAEAIYQSLKSGQGGDPNDAELAVRQAMKHRDKAEAALRKLQPQMEEERELLAEHEERLQYIESLHVEASLEPPVENVYFSFGSSRLLPDESDKLADIIAFLRDYPVFAIKLVGYADTVGNKDYNRRLAERRNHSVVRGLRQAGLPEGTMVTIAIGEAEGPDETRNPGNRRVEVKPYVHGRYIGPSHNGDNWHAEDMPEDYYPEDGEYLEEEYLEEEYLEEEYTEDDVEDGDYAEDGEYEDYEDYEEDPLNPEDFEEESAEAFDPDLPDYGEGERI